MSRCVVLAVIGCFGGQFSALPPQGACLLLLAVYNKSKIRFVSFFFPHCFIHVKSAIFSA